MSLPARYVSLETPTFTYYAVCLFDSRAFLARRDVNSLLATLSILLYQHNLRLEHLPIHFHFFTPRGLCSSILLFDASLTFTRKMMIALPTIPQNSTWSPASQPRAYINTGPPPFSSHSSTLPPPPPLRKQPSVQQKNPRPVITIIDTHYLLHPANSTH